MTKSIKVLLLVTLSFILGPGLVGCSSAASSTQEPAPASTNEAPPIEHSMDHSGGEDASMDHAMDHSAEENSRLASDESNPIEEDTGSSPANSGMATPTVEIPADLDTTTSQLSAQKLYSVTLISNLQPIVINQPHSWVLSVASAEGQPVEDADIAVEVRMPQQNQGMPSQPQVTQNLGEGNYLVEEINFPFAGWWEANFSIRAAGQTDQVTFNFIFEELDTATTQLSTQGLYRARIESQLDPIKINEIHNWILHIETADGQPVENAEIAVTGDMLQHKHGLPTEPRVTQDLGNGDYLVEGLKFQMAGWWTMNFTITTQSQSDMVTFNLILEN